MTARRFTPHQANQTLPLVRPIVSEILEGGRRLREMAEKLGEAAEHDDQTRRSVEHLESLFEELDSIGCGYKDWNFEFGLVDFPAVIGGREVLLCWRSDEGEVTHYHDAEAGYAGRRLIPAALLAPPAGEVKT